MNSKSYTKIKIIIGFSLILTILGALTGVWLSHVKASSTRLSNLVDDQQAYEHIFSMRDSARNRTLALFKMAMSTDPFDQEDEFDYLQAQAEVFIKARDNLQALGMSDQEKRDWAEVRPYVIKGSNGQRKTAELIRDSKIDLAKDILLNEVTPAQITVVNIFTGMLERKKQEFAAKLIDASEKNREVYISISILGGSALVIAAIIAFLVTKIVTKSEQELTLARDEALSASNQKSLFLANMSHELRTPLNAIIGYSEMLQEDANYQKDLDLVSDLDKINISGQNLLTLINDILDLSKIEANKMDLYPETLDIRKLIEEITHTIKPIFSSRRNKLEIVISDSCQYLFSDQQKIRQTLLNLLSNACKFTDQGRVRITVSDFILDEVDMIKIAIEDSGIGMSEKQIENLFLPFSQADPSTTRKYGGTGLGLFISKHYCTILGGDLVVRSTLRKGSTFIVTIPKALDTLPDVDMVA